MGVFETRGLIESILLLIYFYFNYYLLIPRFYFQKKHLLWFLITIGSLILIFLLPNLLLELFNFQQKPDFREKMPPPPLMHERKNELFVLLKMPQLNIIFRFLLVATLSFLMRTTQMWKQSREEKRMAELSYLKSQVNPHFLFNTLNGIYFLSLDESKKTPEAILKLSDLMRYVTTEIEKEYVLLENEINHITNYIELQKLRLDKTIDVRLDISNTNQQMMISPLLLIPFIENAFKFGVNPEKVSIIEIRIETIDNFLQFRISNEKSSLIVNGGTKTGIENVKRRLELQYPNKHKLSIIDNDFDHCVELKLELW